MKILFNEITKIALLKLLENSSNNNVRIKCVAIGCGKPAYDIYADYVSEEDFEIEVNEVNFVIAKKDEKLCDGIEIKYDEDIYNNGFYVRSI